MAGRRVVAKNNHLEEAMALLISNQAAFVEQIARHDKERIALERSTRDHFEKIEERFTAIEATLAQMPKTILRSVLEQLPKALKKEIGFKPST